MSTEHGVEPTMQSVSVQGAADPDRIRDVVSGRTRGQLIDEPQLLLAEGEDTGIFRRPAWNSVLSILSGPPESLLQQDPLLGRKLLDLLTDIIGQCWLQSPVPMTELSPSPALLRFNLRLRYACIFSARMRAAGSCISAR